MEFVNFELAKKLKEKGYPQVKKNTIAMYDENGDWYSLIDTFDYFEYSFEDFDERDCICPTISQVLKWLRKEKYILIGLSPMQEYGGEEKVEWCSTVFKSDKQGGLSWKEEFYYQSYEQAALAGINYTLNNLI
jgi:hypothetical protein